MKQENKNKIWMGIGLFFISLLFVQLALLEYGNPAERQEKINYCINMSGTNEINFRTLDGCKLIVCLVDNNVYEGLISRTDLSACKTAIILEGEE